MDLHEFRRVHARRSFLKNVAAGIGTLAFGDLLNGETANPLAPRKPHFPGKAKSVILFSWKAAPARWILRSQAGAAEMAWEAAAGIHDKGLKLAFIKPTAAVLASPREFKQHGQSGMVFSDYLPHMSQVADDICMVRSMCTDAFNQHPGQCLLFTGSVQPGRPTMGAWTIYGLGSESQNPPGFAVLSSGKGTSGGATNFSSGFLPSVYQGTTLRSTGDPILYLSNPPGVTNDTQRAALDALRDLNDEHRMQTGDMEIASRIASYELAYRKCRWPGRSWRIFPGNPRKRARCTDSTRKRRGNTARTA